MERGERVAVLLFEGLSESRQLSSSEKHALRKFSQRLVELIGKGKGFTCLVTNDRELRSLNQRFLAHDYATDVLSFPGSDEHTLGDIAISIERAAAQAAEFGHGSVDELRILMLHGVLHLCGYDHAKDSGRMARAESKWRAYFGLPATLISRTRSSRLPTEELHP